MAKEHSATFLGAGLGLTIAKNYAYGYSGAVSVGAVQSTHYDLLNFTTGNHIIRGNFQPCSFEEANVVYDFQWKVTFNGIQIYAFIVESGHDYTPYEEINLIIPPLTTVVISASNPAAAAAYDLGALFTGQIVA